MATILDVVHSVIARDLEVRDPGQGHETLALGVLLARGHAAALVDAEPVEAPQVDETAGVVQLLAAAEHATRGLPPEQIPGLSELVLELCDLVRESRSLGY